MLILASPITVYLLNDSTGCFLAICLNYRFIYRSKNDQKHRSWSLGFTLYGAQGHGAGGRFGESM